MLAMGLIMALPSPGSAQSHDHDHHHGAPPSHGHPPQGQPPHGHGHNPPPPRPHGRTTVIIDRSRPGWWRGNTLFVAYTGPRAGYYFAPGYGYYAVPRAYFGRNFVVGAVVPLPMRSYVIVTPAIYGLRPAPPNYRWYYAGPNIVLAHVSTGVIIQSVAGGW
ncbi:hypothetical protein A8V01_15630 [Novosphingobium guangzhouense]|uniref:Uncharacterized protein n=2 Tax=Novosphingobium guangzhouense TaxID=1850347 RepID=A0A2K2G3H3_9SPHN|nr:hypothetical protein A8V01_15630 [Novosphingobium guangzhouense]